MCYFDRTAHSHFPLNATSDTKESTEEDNKSTKRKTVVRAVPKKTPVKQSTKVGSQCLSDKPKTVNVLANDILQDSSDDEVSFKNHKELSSRYSGFVNYYSDNSEDDK